MSSIFISRKKENEDSWISVSDMMAGLMMVFLLLSIIHAKTANERANKIKEAVAVWVDTETKIAFELSREFKDYLNDDVDSIYRAEFDDKELTIKFIHPDVLFDNDATIIKDEFKRVLDDFMPRYLRLLNEKFSEQITEIRIDGHASSRSGAPLKQGYIYNMDLSQGRANSVLKYTINLDELEANTEWMTKTLSANGLSFAQLELTDGRENEALSRRVEFKVVTNSEQALRNAAEEAGIR